MANFDNIKVPKNPSIPLHMTNNTSVFVAGYQYPKSKTVTVETTLEILTPLVVLEECVGYQGYWNKVAINDGNNNYNIIGFIANENIIPANDTKPSIKCNLKEEYLADETAAEIEWREQGVNRVFDDIKRGMYSVLYDTGIEKLEDKNKLKDIMETSLYESLQIIFKDNGKNYSIQDIKEIQNKYYLFGQAEAIDFSLRNCSTMRVLVSVPKKYIQSIDFPFSQNESVLNPEPIVEGSEDAVYLTDNPQVESKYVDLFFDNYKQYEDFFKDISGEVALIPYGALNKAAICFKSRDWLVEPSDVRINLSSYVTKIKDIKDKIDILIIKNTPANYAKQILMSNIDNIWQGKLTVKINIENLKISYMKFETLEGIQIPLNIGVLSFLGDEIVNSKTLVNFILQRHLSKLKELYFYEFRKQKIKYDYETLGMQEALKKYSSYNIPDFLNILFRNNIDQFALIYSGNKDLKIDFITDEKEKIEISKRTKQALKKYVNSFTIKEFSDELKEINTSSDVQDDFKELLEIADFSAVADSAIKLLKAVTTDEDSETTKSQTALSKFLLKYHYPKLVSIEPMPLDISSCVQDNLTAMRNFSIGKAVYIKGEYERYKTISKEYEKNKEIRVKNQIEREGEEIVKALVDFPNSVKDKNLRLLLGVDKPPDDLTKLQALNEYYIPAIKSIEINGILADLLKCTSVTVDPTTFNNLLKKYGNAKQALDTFVAATVCNPFLTSAVKTINGIQIPQFPIYNPDRILANKILDAILDAVQKFLVISIKNILMTAIKNCLRDPNKEKNPGALGSADDIADGLANNINDADINDTLDDLFGTGSNIEKTPDQLNAEREAARRKLMELMDKILCVLSTKELCSLLNNNSVSADTYEVILSVVRNKFPDLKDKIRTYQDIQRIFAKLGKVIDPIACKELDNPLINGLKVPVCSLCDDGTLQAARRALLEDKNLPADVIDDIINDIKDKEAKNLEDILKFLDNDSPFDFSNVPSILCKKGPNGELIPPLAEFAIPIDSFKDLLNLLFKDLYNTFNEEALEWSKTSYSIKSDDPKLLKFDVNTGQIVPNTEQINLLSNLSEKDNRTKNQKSVKTFLPAYLFNDILINKNYTLNKDNITFKTSIDGDLQQKIDIDLIDTALREKVNHANEYLSIFLGDFLIAFDAALVVFSLQSAGAIENVIISKNKFIAAQGAISNLTKFLSIFDNFIRKDPTQIDKAEYKELLKTFGPDVEANAALFESSGVDLYIKIMTFLKQRRAEFDSLIAAIDELIPSDNPRKYFSKKTVGEYLKSKLQENIIIFEGEDGNGGIKNIYKTVLNNNLKYPQYDLEFIDSFQENEKNIGMTSAVTHDIFSLKINKNKISKPYIYIEDYQNVDKDLDRYITDELKISIKTPAKTDLYNAFVKKYNPQNNDVKINANINYHTVSEKIFTACLENVKKNSLFLQLLDIQTAQKRGEKDIGINNVKKPITDFLKLVIQPTPAQVACGVRPHYLDIDNLKDDALENKKNSNCTDELLNDLSEKNKPINIAELQNEETTDTQNILLSAAYRLLLRVYAHDIILRGIGVFGYFDPQILRDDSLFIDYLYDSIESEMRGIDTNLFNLMMLYFADQYKKLNPNDSTLDTNILENKRQIVKNILRYELRNSILPKLSKRIQDDTNKELALNGVTIDKLFKLKFVNTGEDLSKQFESAYAGGPKQITLMDESDGVYLKIITSFKEIRIPATTSSESEIKVIPQYEKIKVFNGKLSDFNDSKPEFNLLFQFLFPVKRYVTVTFIMNVLCTSTRKQILSAFKQTKKSLRRLILDIQTNGEGAIASLNNPQDIIANDANEDIYWFIIKTMLKIPINIAKGFIEGSDPNAGLSSTIYKLGKSIDPSLSSAVIPGIGVPLMFWFGSPFMVNPFNAVYYATGMWYEDANNDVDKAQKEKRNYLDSLFTDTAQIDCDIAKKHTDIITIGTRTEDYYKKDITTDKEVKINKAQASTATGNEKPKNASATNNNEKVVSLLEGIAQYSFRKGQKNNISVKKGQDIYQISELNAQTGKYDIISTFIAASDMIINLPIKYDESKDFNTLFIKKNDEVYTIIKK